MSVVLTAAAMVVGGSGLLSLLGYLPLLAVAESVPARRADLRATLWLLGLTLPPLGGLLGAAWGLTRQLTHPLYSPHADRLRPHLCLRVLTEAPDGPWRAQVVAWLSLALLAGAMGWLLIGLVRLGLDQASVRRRGRRLETPPGAGRVQVWEVANAGLASHRGLSALVVVGPQLERLFTPQEREAVLAHEVCHARRRDSLLAAVAAAALVAQAASPAAWACRRHWRLLREVACDLYAARVVSPQAAEAALAVSREAAGALEELQPLSPAKPQAVEELARRAEYLHLQAGRSSEGDAEQSGVILVLAVVALVAVGVLLAATVQQVPDSFHCAAEALLRAVGH